MEKVMDMHVQNKQASGTLKPAKLPKTTFRSVFRTSENHNHGFPKFGNVMVFGLITLLTACASYTPPVQSGPGVPGLADAPSWIPQGLWRLEDGRFVVGAYRHTRQTTPEGEHIGPVRLSILSADQPPHSIEIHMDGIPLLSHAGGIAIHQNRLYIANALDGRVFHGPWSADAEVIDVETFLTNPTSADNLAVCDQGLLWVGQFYREATLYNRSLGRWRDANGRIKRALAIAYDLGDRRPVKALAVRRRLQGLVLTPDWIVLSCSFGQNRPSDLAMYPSPLSGPPHDFVHLPDGSRIPLYHLNERTENLRLPPMSEEIVEHNHKIWVVFESGALTRFPRARTRIPHLLAYPLPEA